MGKFDNMKSAKVFDNVKKVEQEKAQVVVLQNILSENLVNNPQNGEDITMTEDLEQSMRENGFTDPLEVTDFGMADGKYMILSGHRRRASGVKVFGEGFAFPCIVRHFNTAQEVQNYTLMANSQRDSAKDPLLYVARIEMHEQYLDSIGFKGAKREEIAKRTGLSLQKVDRFKAMRGVILPVHDLVRAEKVGISSVIRMNVLSEAEQMEIYGIMQQALSKDVVLTRETMKDIVEGYKAGKKTWAEIADLPRDSGLPLSGNGAPVGGGGNGYHESGSGNRNDEIRRERDPIAEEYDKMDAADRAARERLEAQEAADAEADHNEDVDADTEENGSKGGKSGRGDKREMTEEEQRLKLGENIIKQMCDLDTNLGLVWVCGDAKQAEDTIRTMGSLSKELTQEVYRLAEEWTMKDETISVLEALAKTVNDVISRLK